MDIIQTVKSIISTKKNIEGVELTSSLSSLGLDSLDLVEITLEIEDKFHIEFTSNEIANLKTVKDVVELIARKTK